MTSAALPARPLARRTLRRDSLFVGGCFFVILFVLIGVSPKLLNDPDSLWHVAVGKMIWNDGRFPTTDSLSHTFAGAPWIAKEWLSQIIAFFAFRIAGWTGVVFLSALAIAAAFALFFGWLQMRMRRTAAILVTALAFLLAAPHLLARPHVLVLPILVAWTCGLLVARERRVAPSLLLTILMLLWANMHASFPLGFVIAGCLAAEGVVQAPGRMRIALAVRWAFFLGACAIAALATPYGVDGVLVPLRMSGNPNTLRYIREWQPLEFDLQGILALLLAAACLLVLATRPLENAFRLILTMLLAVMMVRHSRFIETFALVAPLLAARALGRLAPRENFSGRRSSHIRTSHAEQHRGAMAVEFAIPYESLSGDDGARALPAGVTTAFVVALCVGAAALAAIIAPRPAASIAPENALNFARAHGISGPIYNDYDFGGFLISEGVKTFVDGRSDQLFLERFLPDLKAALDDESDAPFAALLDRYGVTWAIVRSQSPDAAHLSRMAGWSNVYADDTATLFTRNVSSH